MEPESSVLSLLGRERRLFEEDLSQAESELAARVESGSFLVVGGAGSIGQAVVKELFRRRPRRLHVVDLSENGLVELVRDIRSSLGYIEGDFRTLPLDCGGPEYAAFVDANPPYDYVLNLSALKHVRSEKDPYTLMRMLRTNVLNTERTQRARRRRRRPALLRGLLGQGGQPGQRHGRQQAGDGAVPDARRRAPRGLLGALRQRRLLRRQPAAAASSTGSPSASRWPRRGTSGATSSPPGSRPPSACWPA